MNHPFNTLVRKLNDRGVTLRREGDVEYPDGTVVFKADAALLYTDCGEKYVVVKTEHGYQVRTDDGAIAGRGDDEHDACALADDICSAV